MSEPATSAPLLAFTAVAADPELESIDFVVRAGQCCVIEASLDAGEQIADLAQGLEAPMRGSVVAFGRNWQDLTARQVHGLRARMGRVFRAPAWIHNLNVDENVLLPQLDRSQRPEAEIRSEADVLARRLGLDGLPRSRPHATDAVELAASACVRAFSGAPDLVLIETRAWVPPKESHSGLVSIVHEFCARGRAVVWFGDADGAHSVLPPGPRVRVQRGGLVVSAPVGDSDMDQA